MTAKKEHVKRSEASVPPWVGYNEEETMKSQILALSTVCVYTSVSSLQFVYFI